MESNPGFVGNFFSGGRASLVRVFTSGTVYTPTPGTTSFIVEVVGGGGAGGGIASGGGGGAVAGGGGGGGYSRRWFTGPLLQTYPYAIGAGGTAGTAGANPGNTGGTTTFGANPTLLQATGGVGGTGDSGSGGIHGTAGGAGGVGTLGDLNLTGSSGSPGIQPYDVTVAAGNVSGIGGNSPLSFGVGGIPIVNNNANGNANGNPGAGYGGGGSGAAYYINGAQNNSGGVGTAGIIVITEFS